MATDRDLETPPTVNTDTDDIITVLLFGKTGDGKSTLGNMILTEHDNPTGISGPLPPFAVSDSLKTVTMGGMTEVSQSKMWRVIDTVGLLSSDDPQTDENLVNQLYDELCAQQRSIHWLCYVKKATKFTNADERCWLQFKQRFGKYRSNIILVFTSCQKESWIEENKDFITEHMRDDKDDGDRYTQVCVDFPPPDDDQRLEQVLERKRTETRKRLQQMLRESRPTPIVLEERKGKLAQVCTGLARRCMFFAVFSPVIWSKLLGRDK